MSMIEDSADTVRVGLGFGVIYLHVIESGPIKL